MDPPPSTQQSVVAMWLNLAFEDWLNLFEIFCDHSGSTLPSSQTEDATLEHAKIKRKKHLWFIRKKGLQDIRAS